MNFFERPDWNILGVRVSEEEVWVIASDTLVNVEIEEIVQEPWDRPLLGLPTTRNIRMGALMHSVTMCMGKDYPSALANLFQTWTPEEQNPQELTEAQRELEK